MDIDDRRPELRRRPTVSSLNAMWNNNLSFSQETEAHDHSTSSEDDDADEVERMYKQKQAKELLNQVFVVLGIAPITDLRNTTMIQREVTTAIELIRKAADDILDMPNHSQNSMEEKKLTIDDTEELLDGLKLLFACSEYDEQVRLLTIAPSRWGRLQIENFFRCNQWQARKALELRKAYGVLTRVTNFVGNHPIDPLLIEDIKKFYQDDAISRQTSNEKEIIHDNKQPVPIRYMLTS